MTKRDQVKLKQRETPVITGPSVVARRKKVSGIRVSYDVGGGSKVATRDHPTAVKWEVTKHGQLILRDKHGHQVARYRQFVWRHVVAGEPYDVESTNDEPKGGGASENNT